ncbi:cytochrome P450 [Entophlyctis helioformis]|nr:cytochrome P450 [Entophlyctis helioformis]
MAVISTLANSISPLQSILIAVAAAAAVPLLWMALSAVSNSPPKGVPSLFAWPLVGQAFTVAKYAQVRQLHAFFAEGFRKYGSIFAVPLAGSYMVTVSDADAIKVIFNNTDSFVRGKTGWETTKDIIKYSLVLLPTGPTWRRHRKLMQPAFGPSHLRQTVDAATEVADKIKADWTSVMAATGEKTIVVDVYKYMGAVAFDVICKIAFSKDDGAVGSITKKEFSKTAEMFDEISALMQLVTHLLPPAMWSWMGISSSSPRVTSVRDSSQAFVMDVIAERRAATSLGEHQEKGKWDMDLLDRFLQNSAELNPDGEGLSEDEIIGETLAMFMAGHETTANSMTFIIMSLCQNPDVMAKVVDDIDRIYTQIGGNLTTENLFEFKYLDWVIKETMRLHPVVPFFARETAKPVTLMGHAFPAKMILITSIMNLHRNPKYWADPDTFNPDRWAQQPVPGSYLPFGDGPTMCIGQKMANIEMRVVMINLLRRFTFEMVPDQKLEFFTAITYGLLNGLKVKVTERKM